jgi:hypothetical protein
MKFELYLPNETYWQLIYPCNHRLCYQVHSMTKSIIISLEEPFTKWGSDFIGPMQPIEQPIYPCNHRLCYQVGSVIKLIIILLQETFKIWGFLISLFC